MTFIDIARITKSRNCPHYICRKYKCVLPLSIMYLYYLAKRKIRGIYVAVSEIF